MSWVLWFEGRGEKRRRGRSLPKTLGDKSEGVGWLVLVLPLNIKSTYQIFRDNFRGGGTRILNISIKINISIAGK